MMNVAGNQFILVSRVTVSTVLESQSWKVIIRQLLLRTTETLLPSARLNHYLLARPAEFVFLCAVYDVDIAVMQ